MAAQGRGQGWLKFKDGDPWVLNLDAVPACGPMSQGRHLVIVARVDALFAIWTTNSATTN